MLLKQKPSKDLRKWIARFYYFRHYTPLEARVLLTIIRMSEIDKRQLYLHAH